MKVTDKQPVKKQTTIYTAVGVMGVVICGSLVGVSSGAWVNIAATLVGLGGLVLLGIAIGMQLPQKNLQHRLNNKK